MTRIKVGNHALAYEDGYWYDFFDNWRLETIFKSGNKPLSNVHYEVMLLGELQKIGANYVDDKEGCWLEFKHKEDAMSFMLRWS
jgi:hypothetical protein